MCMFFYLMKMNKNDFSGGNALVHRNTEAHRLDFILIPIDMQICVFFLWLI